MYFQKLLERRREEGKMNGEDAMDALRYLAKYLRDKGDLEQAELYVVTLLNHSPDREGEALLRDIQSRIAAQ